MRLSAAMALLATAGCYVEAAGPAYVVPARPVYVTPAAPPPEAGPPPTEAPPPQPQSYAAPEVQSDTPPPPAPPGTDVASDEAFTAPLAAYGTWTVVAGYGSVWVPAVGYGWRPYYYGRWVLTDWGWTFVSDDPWGWAAYHYGRWNWALGVGWFWIPGRVWAPAWVTWRYGGGYVSWAPLGPPGVVFGFNHPAWVAVGEAHFTRPIATVAVAPRVTVGIVRTAQPLGGPMARPVRGAAFGPPVARISAATGRPVVAVPANRAVHVTHAGAPQVHTGPAMRSPVNPRPVARPAPVTRAPAPATRAPTRPHDNGNHHDHH
jgi:hypothetical protein